LFIGILAAQLINWRIAQPVPGTATINDIRVSWNGQMGWRWTVLCLPQYLPDCFFILMWFVPESPRWLAKNKGNHSKVQRILAKIGGATMQFQNSRSIEDTLRETPEKNALRLLKQTRNL